ncbi:hypothetical protein QBC40DRAFT_262412 [Triangularia verruculosa]|uniref:Uncharacterized protein n=1 Tax=Triangularia verruculosa TaxID=2587418 RepID=A0AAN6XTP1_9PEZI|nr:hypothetical protein QBC40DRAFT_262412 [Triangularia verruculosa]
MTSTIPTRITRAGWALARPPPTFRPTLLRQQRPTIQSSTHSTLRKKSTITKFLRPLLEKVLHHRGTRAGRPCDCPKCLQAEWRPFCGLCREKPTAHQELTRIRDEAGPLEYVFTNWCEDCWKARLKRREEEREEEDDWEQEEQNNKQNMPEAEGGRLWKQQQDVYIRQVTLQNKLKQIMRLPPGERVLLSYAVQRYIDALESVSESIYIPPKGISQFCRQSIWKGLSRELRITKEGAWYFCDKRRVDAMDFKLWHFRPKPNRTDIPFQSAEGEHEESSKRDQKERSEGEQKRKLDGEQKGRSEESYLWEWMRSVWFGKKM